MNVCVDPWHCLPLWESVCVCVCKDEMMQNFKNDSNSRVSLPGFGLNT